MSSVKRRSFLGIAAGGVMAAGRAAAAPYPIVDTHIHLFDTTRPQGVPWPEKTNAALYKPALPDRYRKLAVPHGITGAIVVEASSWFDDNQWVLDLIAKDPLFLGMVGNLDTGKPEFAKQLERFQRNPLFRGTRYGNIWGRNLADETGKPAFISDLKLLAQANLSLDTANQNADMLKAAIRISDKVPELRIIIDHLPQMVPTTEQVRELAARPKIFVKLSAVYRKIDGKVPRELSVYRETLDRIFSAMGEDRVMYGSDWPNSDNWRPYDDVFNLVDEYFKTKSQSAREKYFAKNSQKAYLWKPRKI